MGRLILLAFLALAAIPVSPQNMPGTIEGRVTRQDQSIGIPNVQVTLQGPNRIVTSEELSAWFPPDPSMTPAMRSQIDAMISLPQLVVTLDQVASAVTRMQNLGAKVPAAALAA